MVIPWASSGQVPLRPGRAASSGGFRPRRREQRTSDVQGAPAPPAASRHRTPCRPERSTMQAQQSTVPPAASMGSTASRKEPPVVITSSMTTTFAPGAILKARQRREFAVLALHVQGRHAHPAGGLIAGNDGADGRRDDDVGLAEPGHDLLGERLAEALGALGELEDQVLLQEHRRMPARGQDEVAFAQGPGAAEFFEDVFGVHASQIAFFRGARKMSGQCCGIARRTSRCGYGSRMPIALALDFDSPCGSPPER